MSESTREIFDTWTNKSDFTTAEAIVNVSFGHIIFCHSWDPSQIGMEQDKMLDLPSPQAFATLVSWSWAPALRCRILPRLHSLQACITIDFIHTFRARILVLKIIQVNFIF